MITIRKEQSNDYKAIYNVVKTAFSEAEHSDGTEQDLVEQLRLGTAYIPELSLAALDGDKIIGHIMFTKIGLGNTRSLALAPLAIDPSYQNMGIGTQLIQEGHRIAKEMGYEYSIVLGSETYYPRCGYVPASEFGIMPPFEVEDENFMAIPLQEGIAKPNCTVVYDKAFS